MATPNDERLLSIASSICNGDRIDWSDRDPTPNDGTVPAVLTELAVLDRIAGFYRSVQSSDTTSAAPDLHAADPETWAHFKILERIGSGASGTVYRARDTKLQTDVALKLLWPKPSDRAKPFPSKEARLLARVRHENVVTVHGADEIDGRVGIWMDFVRGRTLASQLRDHGSFSAREAANIGRDICHALAAVHGAGLVHGDVKAHNVMREQGGRTVLMDFGTGKDVAAEAAGQRRSSDFAGTPLYLGPEVFEGQPRTKLTDIYSLGVLLYHLVTNAYPVDGRTRVDVAEAHRRGERQYLRDVRPDLPADFVAAVERALSVDPKDRYQSAGAFEAALAPMIGRSVDEDRHRWPGWIRNAAITTAVLVLGAVSTYWISSRISRNQPVAPSARTAGEASPAAVSALATGAEYQIETTLYRLRDGAEERLRSGTRIQPGDQLFANVRVSVPTYVYIVDEDDVGVSFLLFPLPGQPVGPLPAGSTRRIPGVVGGEQVNWQVTSAGGREHFLIFASPERLAVFEQMFAALPSPERDKPIQYARLSSETVGRLRGIGGLTTSPPAPAPETPGSRLATQYSTPLGEGAERARGLWVRQFTVENPQ